MCFLLGPSTVWKRSAVLYQENYFSFRQKRLEYQGTTESPENNFMNITVITQLNPLMFPITLNLNMQQHEP